MDGIDNLWKMDELAAYEMLEKCPRGNNNKVFTIF
jgi:hypothetical protein